MMTIPRPRGSRSASRHPPSRYLDGQLLIAMPGMTDERFARSVIYLCAHSEEGAMGIVVNHPASDVSFSDLLVQLDVVAESDRIMLPPKLQAMQVLMGGPVETSRGFVLHSSDYFIDQATLPIDEGVSLTATVDILRAIAAGNGPEKIVFALGYAGWSAGQLEQEIQANGWLNCGADANLIFHAAPQKRYELALKKIGIEPDQIAMLSSEAGHG